MNWINKNAKQKPYRWADDLSIIDKSRPAKYQEAWFKTKRGKVYRASIEEIERQNIKWEWWQPLSNLSATALGSINPSKTPSETKAQKVIKPN